MLCPCCHGYKFDENSGCPDCEATLKNGQTYLEFCDEVTRHYPQQTEKKELELNFTEQQPTERVVEQIMRTCSQCGKELSGTDGLFFCTHCRAEKGQDPNSNYYKLKLK